MVHEARAGAVRWSVADFNNEPVPARLAHDFALAVSGVETAPISVEAAEDKVWEVAAGAKLEIPLKITRRGDYNEALKLKGYGAPAIETLKEIDVEAKAHRRDREHRSRRREDSRRQAHDLFSRADQGQIPRQGRTITLISAPIRISIK